MKLSIIIKPILALAASLVASTTLASAYTSYSPIVDSKNLSIIITVTMLLGLIALYQKQH
ncbi:hypothetical protein [Candidatus Thioglobus sp.]|jgi:hypothetical protein|uniref:hypothetical protein n=1 Tax=Candidatus Thioglobus sp. TaxID=2026721 RepID=UPI00177369F1|nr:hypothetical protein [Candidatus Thioglobus sp.]HIF47347.1 hypothetical protein [Candidatus Thioglobus sp.]HIL03146.1 hypothetical protein [Candidatus Thioglobus autotrophicus]